MDLEAILKTIKNLPHKDDGRVYVSALAPITKEIGVDHALAVSLWRTGQKAAREVAVRIADPCEMHMSMLDDWVRDLDDWGLTDALTGHLVKYTPYAVDKAHEWAKRTPEFERRAGFATIAQMAWTQNDFTNDVFLNFLPVIKETATDDRFYVKKSVNWALRDIGKRNAVLQKHAQKLALELQQSNNKTARWVGMHRYTEITT